MAELQRGVVKWFNDAKGFGFIEHESGRDVFVHYSVITQDGFKTLKDGEEVDYELKEGEKGLHAARVVRLGIAGSKMETSTDEQLVAPRLETGSVQSAAKSAAEMIEITQEDQEDSTDAMLSHGDETEKKETSIEH